MSDYPPPAPGGATGPRAGFGSRVGAILLDGLLVLVAAAIVGLVVGAILGSLLGSLVQLGLIVGYYIYLEGSPSGQTVGKRALGIRIIDLNGGGGIGPGRAALRYVGRILSSIPCALGYFWMLWDPEKQTWHDKIASSVVVPVADYPVAAWPG